MSDRDRREKAIALWRQAYGHQMRKELDEAIRLYRESLALYPTAEAHTFLGWAYSFQGRLEQAIAECRAAIAVDPEFGNPYNDIGVYLMEQGDLDGAIPWLEKAKRAPRYEPRHYPYQNLARVYRLKGMMLKAIAELEQAQLCVSDNESASVIREQLETLRSSLN